MQAIPMTAPSLIRRNKEKLAQFIQTNTSIATSKEVRSQRLNRINRDMNKWLVSELEIELRATDFSEAQ